MGKSTPFASLDAYRGKTHDLNVIIETPKRSRNKFVSYNNMRGKRFTARGRYRPAKAHAAVKAALI